ncbi:MAG TPA: NAD(P)H-dependent oxidoreductase [Rhodocyclaceae bacterium]
MPKILVFSGSIRRDSVNRRLAQVAAAAVSAAGGEVTLLDLREYPLPIYDGDLEDAEGLPANAVALKTIFKAHAGLFIVSPEYNGFFPPLLKNTIDWLSRPHGAESGLAPYAGKVAAIAAASPGGLGGIRCLPLLRQQLSNLSVTVLPQQLALPSADRAFDESGALRDAGQASSLQRIAAELLRVTGLLAG